MEYAEDNYLMISGIQHFRFCKRQWALIHIEQQWAENEHTVIGETRRREIVEITEELRNEVKLMFQEMHQYYERKYTPKVKTGKGCNSCSLKDICMPRLGKVSSVKTYMNQVFMEEDI